MDAQNNFFPMDVGTMPMQTDASELQNPPMAESQTPNQRTGAFGQSMYMGVSALLPLYTTSPDVLQADPKTSNGVGYSLGFMTDTKRE